MTLNTEAPNRDNEHGGVSAVGEVSQAIKDAMRCSSNWQKLPAGYKESLDMIAHKIARILSGNDPLHHDHWIDVKGYADAALRFMSEAK